MIAYHALNYYSRSTVVQMPYPTDETRLIVQLAKGAIAELYCPGRRFMKVGAGLVELVPGSLGQGDLFTSGQPAHIREMMRVLDRVNQRFDRGAEGVQKKWKIRQAYTSPAYTAKWGDMPEAVT